ncbi:MAG: iron-sulfur cluster insertion protein ErpA [Ferrovibrio sp.]|uniref:iron-sulfur cluster insertion protein ErpA n=1 Tax=Ferrovibrio sp. TaxID=1917215 RepID=UPI0026338E1D|nr:iron-sulfur cluster insertion protein ErpA [Ferrovibrio sp.]MCW0236418.1 iron-sulfur cluster insertion protein ErpA [Ferrovibrio sp.]
MTETATQTVPVQPPATFNGDPVGLTASAARRILKVAESEGNPALGLRISVSGGGCSGFQYSFTLDADATADDVVISRDGARLLVDTVSLDYLRGSELDFVEDLSGAGFRINNPLASSSCGCGNSFAV